MLHWVVTGKNNIHITLKLELNGKCTKYESG